MIDYKKNWVKRIKTERVILERVDLFISGVGATQIFVLVSSTSQICGATEARLNVRLLGVDPTDPTDCE